MINELFTDAFNGHGLQESDYLAPLDQSVITLMAARWDETNGGFDRTLSDLRR